MVIGFFLFNWVFNVCFFILLIKLMFLFDLNWLMGLCIVINLYRVLIKEKLCNFNEYVLCIFVNNRLEFNGVDIYKCEWWFGY